MQAIILQLRLQTSILAWNKNSENHLYRREQEQYLKAILLRCLADLVREKHGEKVWDEVMSRIGMSRQMMQFMLCSDELDYNFILKLISEACDVTGTPLADAAESFTNHLVSRYATHVYPMLMNNYVNTRQMLLDLNNLHEQLTSNIKNTQPPKFHYQWLDEQTLILSFTSPRPSSLLVYPIGMIKAAAKMFGEEVNVTEIGEKSLRVELVNEKQLPKAA